MYLFGSTVELSKHFMPEMVLSTERFALIITSFMIGCVCIGLILLDHEHCDLDAVESGSSSHQH